MADPTISLRNLRDPSRLHPDDWVWITSAERDALVEAVEALNDATEFRDLAAWNRARAALNRFSDVGVADS